MLAHLLSGEDSPARLSLLKLYARYEVRILRLLFHLLESRAIRFRPFSELVYWTLVMPAARWAIAGTPLTPPELERFVATLPPGRIAVGPCRCRLAHLACEHPLETDIVIREGFGIWTDLFPGDYREIDAAEALAICAASHREGMAQMLFRHMDTGNHENYFVICNCCRDGCLPLLACAFYGAERYPFHRGLYRARADRALCRGCGICVERCPFGGRALIEGKSEVGECYGCGLCASHCPEGATSMA